MEPHPHTPTPPPPSPLGQSLFQGASPKLTFIFGLVAGIAATAIIGLAIILPRAYGSGKTPKTTTAAAAPTNTTAATAPTFTNVAKVTDSDYIRGNKQAKLTLITYTDLECPFCKTFHPTTKQILEAYPDQVRLVYRNFPLSFHANAQKEGEASLCVGKLGGNDKYWSFVDKVFERTTSNGTGFALDQLGPLAKEVGVNQANFQKCLDSGEMASVVTDEETNGGSGGATGTPTTFLVDQNGQTIDGIPGAYPFDQAKAYIDQALAKI